MTKRYRLCGYSSAGAEPPHFVEPVFFDGDSCYVQSTDGDGERITAFIPISDEIEIVQGGIEEFASVGDYKFFAMRDVGDRIVCGDRQYVTKYIRQNILKFTDKPYFQHDCQEFSRTRLPELYFVNDHRDLLEASVVANSVRRFYFTRYREQDGSGSLQIQLKKGRRRPSAESDSAQSMLFEWLEFAKKDAPKIATKSRWAYVVDSFERCMADVPKRSMTPSLIYLIIARSYVGDNSDGANTAVQIDYSLPLSNMMRDEFHFRHLKGTAPGNALTIWSDARTRERLLSRMKRSVQKDLDHIAQSIASKLDAQSVSKVEISMHIFFFSLIFKFEAEKSEKLSLKDGAES